MLGRQVTGLFLYPARCSHIFTTGNRPFIQKFDDIYSNKQVPAERFWKEGYKICAFSRNPHISATFDFYRGFGEYPHGWRPLQNVSDFFDQGVLFEKIMANIR